MKKATAYFQRGTTLHSVDLVGEAIWVDIPVGEEANNAGNFGGVFVNADGDNGDEDEATRCIFGFIVYVDIQDMND